MTARFVLPFLILLSTSITLLHYSTIHTYAQSETEAENCDPSYPDVCIPPPPPDLNCGDVADKNFGVVQPDPHGFDRDGDGIGSEA